MYPKMVDYLWMQLGSEISFLFEFRKFLLRFIQCFFIGSHICLFDSTLKIVEIKINKISNKFMNAFDINLQNLCNLVLCNSRNSTIFARMAQFVQQNSYLFELKRDFNKNIVACPKWIKPYWIIFFENKY